MKPLHILLVTLAAVLICCRGAENKADQSEPARTNGPVDAGTKPLDSMPKDPAPTTRRAPETSGPEEILAKLDSHVISKADYTVSPGGGITNCVITITNTLPDATFQKIMLGVQVLDANNSPVKSSIHEVINLEPKMSKVVKLPNNTTGTTVKAWIIKVKSAELTKGEWALINNQPQ